MNFKQTDIESLTPAVDLAHKLQEGSANISTITNALTKAGFSERIQTTVQRLINSEWEQGHNPTAKYQEQQPYP